jgi:two-component SAPR family response regulator
MTHQTKDDPAHVLKGARILVVEDEFLIAMELGSILLEAGAEVIGPCRSTAEAHSLLRTVGGVRAAILDLRLGNDTSIPLARHLTRHGVPFIFFTGQVDMSPIHAEYPTATIISKPFQRRAILAALADISDPVRDV